MTATTRPSNEEFRALDQWALANGQATIADPRHARYQVGSRTYYCLHPTCPRAHWPEDDGGDYRYLSQDHFTDDGRCKHAARAAEGS
jgi:hypothetical protein